MGHKKTSKVQGITSKVKGLRSKVKAARSKVQRLKEKVQIQEKGKEKVMPNLPYDREERRRKYLEIGVIQVVNKSGDRKTIDPSELERYEAMGYGSEHWLYHPTEAPYPNGRLFLAHQVEEMLAKGWTEFPTPPKEQKPAEEEKKAKK